MSEPQALLSAQAIAAAVDAVAQTIAPRVDDETVAVCLLTGGLWFAADLTRALSRRGRNLKFDALWLASYGDARASRGVCEVRAGLQRPVAGRRVLLIDDVFDTGIALNQARDLMVEAGAEEVLSVVFARKTRAQQGAPPDFAAWAAPDRFLVGYGLDDAGAWRGLPGLAALD